MLNLKSIKLYFFSIIKLAYLKFKTLYHKTNFYNKKLINIEPTRIFYKPSVFLITPLVDADKEIYKIENVNLNSIWKEKNTSKLKYESLHNFLWLTKVDRKDGGAIPQSIINSWISKYYNYNSRSWNMNIMSKRIIAWSSNLDITLSKSNDIYRKNFFLSIVKQSNFLLKNIKNLPIDSSRIISLSAIILSGLIFKENSFNLKFGIRELEKITTIYFDKSGFPKSRNPEEAFISIKYLILIREWLKEAQEPIPEFLNNIILKCGKCYNFFTNSNKYLPLFNGASETSHGKYDIFLKTFKYNFKNDETEIGEIYKIKNKKIELFFDVGNAPSSKFSNNYQAGCLAFELISKGEKIICNTGYGKYLDSKFSLLSRSTAAHSTLYLNNTSSSLFQKNEVIKKIYGNSLIQQHKIIEKKLSEDEKHYYLFASHNGYEKKYGYLHKRTIKFSKKENIIYGTDELQKTRNSPHQIHFFIRFHIYPGIKIVKTQGGNSALISLSNKEGWLFKSIGSNLKIEKDIFLGRKQIINNECICINGNVEKPDILINWQIEKVS